MNTYIKFIFLPFFIFVVHSTFYKDYIFDDAGITYTYARNLSNGFGIVFYPGDEKVEGYSHPLWLFILALFMKLGLFHPILTPKIFSIFITFFTFYILFKLSATIIEGGKITIFHLFPIVLLSFNVSFVLWNVSGMENAIYAFILCFSIYRFLIEINKDAKFPLSSFLFFLTSLTRPEGILYFFPSFLLWLYKLANHKKDFKKFVLWCFIFIIFSGFFISFRLFYFADILPNTYYAKHGSDSIYNRFFNFNSPGWIYVKNAIEEYNLIYGFPLILLALLGNFSSFRFFMFLATIVSLIFPIFSLGDWAVQYRFLTPFFVLFYMLVSLGIIRIYMWIQTLKLKLINIVFILLLGFFTFVLLYPNYSIYSSIKNHLSLPFLEVLKRGKYFEEMKYLTIEENPSLLDPDVGGTSFTGKLKVVDLAGLTDYFIARDKRRLFFKEYILEDKKPTFVHFHSGWGAGIAEYFTKEESEYYPMREAYGVFPPRYAGSLEGDYVRRDRLAINIENPIDLNENLEFLDLLDIRHIVEPGENIRLNLFFRAKRELMPEIFYYIYLSAGEKKILLKKSKFTKWDKRSIYTEQGWQPLVLWRKNELIKQSCDIKLPNEISQGKYDLLLSLKEGKRNFIKIAELEINRKKLRDKIEEDSQFFKRLINERKWEDAYNFYRQSFYLKEKNLFQNEIEKVRQKIIENLVKNADLAMDKGDFDSASLILLKASSYNRFHKELSDRLKRCSKFFYQRGKQFLKRKDYFLYWKDAYECFKMAFKLNPSNSWAMRRTEKLRIYNYIWKNVGKEEMKKIKEGDGKAMLYLLMILKEYNLSNDILRILEIENNREKLKQLDSKEAFQILNFYYSEKKNILKNILRLMSNLIETLY